jgi:hypothetical protein
MKKANLKVKIYGGVPPFSLKIILFKGDDIVTEFERPTSFEYLFEKLKGEYNLMISGPNPMSEQRRTVLSIDDTEIKLSSDADPNPCERVGKSYLVQFPFSA